MKLVVFDLDGTLARTFEVDEECFVQALRHSLRIEMPNTNWLEYEHVTDSGIVKEAFVKAFGRVPNAMELSRFVEFFVDLLAQRYRANSHLFGEVPGAASMIHGLKEHPTWRVAIATGSWERSARFKMKMAAIGVDDCPAAFAEDGPSREAIVKEAITRACVHYDESHFERIVSVGDAPWDVQIAKKLNLPFIGVGNAHRAAILRNLGASHVVEDFRSYDECLQCLDEARIPETS